MTESMQNQLIAEASRQNVKLVDRDVVKCFPDLTDSLDENDAGAISEALHKMAKRSPHLVKPQKGWGEMDAGSDEWRKREEAFRASLRTSHRVGPLPWKLDSALLEDHELQALHRVLGGRGSSYDRSILDYAQRRLSSTGGDAA